MLRPSLYSISWIGWNLVSMAFIILMVLAVVSYNLTIHPLASVPGPFWARASGIPSWYHAKGGIRHIWLLQLFRKYGNIIRPAPNLVLFCDPEADKVIYSNKSNVRRSDFYRVLKRKEDENMPLNIVDVSEHAARRKLLNLAFIEKSLRPASRFIIMHVDRWHQIILDEDDGADNWTRPRDLASNFDELVFDILGDICFGKSFDLKEPGDNPMKAIPHTLTEYMRFYYPFCRSPFLSLLSWIKPRGFDWLINFVAPPLVHQYNKFVHNTIGNRIALQKDQEDLPEEERRQDMFYFLYEAINLGRSSGFITYNEGDLRADCGLLMIAGSDKTSLTLSSLFFYLSGNPIVYRKLVDEIRATFDSVQDVAYGPKLTGCIYLRACIDEVMRLTPVIPCEPPRQVLAGGIEIMRTHYVAGTTVGTVPWANGRNEEVYGDASVFRPERWIVDKISVTEEEVARLKANFRPFLSGPGVCPGKNLALMEMMIIVSRTLHRFELRRVPGSNRGGDDDYHYQLEDVYVTARQGPDVQFRRRRES